MRSTRPHSPLTIKTSSMRIGCEKAICKPAMKLPSTGLAAIPATRPATPAEASRLAPNWRAPGKVSSMKPRPSKTMMALALRVSTEVCVSTRRARILSSTSTGLRSEMVLLIELTQAIASQVRQMISSTLTTRENEVRNGVVSGAPVSTSRSANSTAATWLGRNAYLMALVV